jgi:hypothetical protein
MGQNITEQKKLKKGKKKKEKKKRLETERKEKNKKKKSLGLGGFPPFFIEGAPWFNSRQPLIHILKG